MERPRPQRDESDPLTKRNGASFVDCAVRRQPISRVLCDEIASSGDHSSQSAVAYALWQPTRSVLVEVGTSRCLFGLAPAGVYPAATVANRAVNLTSPFHLARSTVSADVGGVFSVALSVPITAVAPCVSPGVTWQRAQWSRTFLERLFRRTSIAITRLTTQRNLISSLTTA